MVKLKKVNKVDNYGTTCIVIGYANHHSGTCYRMWDPETGGVHKTRDILWLHWMYWTNKLDKTVLLEPGVYLDWSYLMDTEGEDIAGTPKIRMMQG